MAEVVKVTWGRYALRRRHGLRLSIQGSLEKMMSITVRVIRWCGLLVSARMTEILCMLAKGMNACWFMVHAVGMVFDQTGTFVPFGRKICEYGSVGNEINHQVQPAHNCFRRNR